ERGCQDGEVSHLPSVLVMFVRPPPSGFITKRSAAPLSGPPKMIFVASGDHAEPEAKISVSCVGLEPSALTTQMCGGCWVGQRLCWQALVKVIFEPSGDQAGFESPVWLLVSRCTLLPSAFIT